MTFFIVEKYFLVYLFSFQSHYLVKITRELILAKIQSILVRLLLLDMEVKPENN